MWVLQCKHFIMEDQNTRALMYLFMAHLLRDDVLSLATMTTVVLFINID